jgi:dTDP-4-dehydrorhamnose 3,5-epimerase
MPFQKMKIQGAWVHTPIRHKDARGHFEEQFQLSSIEDELSRVFVVKQVNQSVSHKGVVRGIHWTDSQEGQAKYISCAYGAFWDVVVDLRKNSPTYGQWDSVYISGENGKSVFISEGLGHAFLALEDGTVANYLCTSKYNPSADRTVNPLDATLAIGFLQVAKESGIEKLSISDRDRDGESF